MRIYIYTHTHYIYIYIYIYIKNQEVLLAAPPARLLVLLEHVDDVVDLGAARRGT